MERLRVVGLSELLGNPTEVCVGLEFLQGSGDFRVDEVFEALQQYLEQHREELRRRGPQHVRVSLVRAISAAGQTEWRARGQRLAAAV